MNTPLPLHRFTSSSLARALFKSEVPESLVRSLPAQSLYMAIKHNGLPSSIDILELTTLEQARLMLDLDCWSHDTFNEENFWEWLNVCNSHSDLSLMQRLLKSMDLKLAALLMARHVEYVHFEEATDEPPGPAWYTPDKGLTWIHILIEHKEQHFLLGRFLALVYESDSDLFYQLLAISQAESPSSLEERAYEDKCKRVVSHGIPDAEYAGEVNTPLSNQAVLAELEKGGRHPQVHDISSIEPLLYDGGLLQPLASLFSHPELRDDLELEMTLLMNAGLVRYAVDFSEQQQVLELAGRIKGALNIGMEVALGLSDRPVKDIYQVLGLRKIYGLGLNQLFELRKLARNLRNRLQDRCDDDPPLQVMLETTSSPLPCQPAFFKADGSLEETDGKLLPGQRAIESLAEIEALKQHLLKVEQ